MVKSFQIKLSRKKIMSSIVGEGLPDKSGQIVIPASNLFGQGKPCYCNYYFYLTFVGEGLALPKLYNTNLLL